MSADARRMARVRGLFVAAVAALLTALAVQAADLAAAPDDVVAQATEGPTTGLALNLLTPVTGLVAGGSVQFTITSSGDTDLFSIETKLCKTGLSGWTAANYGYGANGNRCVKEFTPFGVQPAVPGGGL